MNPGDGAVTALAFHRPAASAAPSHLLNGSSDGSISVWQVGYPHGGAFNVESLYAKSG